MTQPKPTQEFNQQPAHDPHDLAVATAGILRLFDFPSQLGLLREATDNSDLPTMLVRRLSKDDAGTQYSAFVEATVMVNGHRADLTASYILANPDSDPRLLDRVVADALLIGDGEDDSVDWDGQPDVQLVMSPDEIFAALATVVRGFETRPREEFAVAQ